jgi:hypothetical protein
MIYEVICSLHESAENKIMYTILNFPAISIIIIIIIIITILTALFCKFFVVSFYVLELTS